MKRIKTILNNFERNYKKTWNNNNYFDFKSSLRIILEAAIDSGETKAFKGFEEFMNFAQLEFADLIEFGLYTLEEKLIEMEEVDIPKAYYYLLYDEFKEFLTDYKKQIWGAK